MESLARQSQSQKNSEPDVSEPANHLVKEDSRCTPSGSGTPASSQSQKDPSRSCGRRRRHTISNNHIEFAIYHCLRDVIHEEDEGVVGDGYHDEDEDEEDPNYNRISTRRQDQSLFELHHCDVIVLKTDNGWCFDQEIFLPAWKRDSYEVADQDSSSISGQEFVKVDEIRLD